MEGTAIKIQPLSATTFNAYIAVGKASYNQHYLHLWKNNDPTPYMESSFTTEVLNKEVKDTNTDLFIIHVEECPVGILKITKDSAIASFTPQEALLLDKIYILKEHSGKGVGKKVLDFVEDYARKLHKKILWLDTMKKGPALQFYLNQGFRKTTLKLLDFPNVKESEREMYIMVKEL